uniref:G-protein coupled receptors family 1 profile domain-containing protein n=1 Tax=Xiphophorus maculatus TaxID=8083 RepID=A0A3B5Q6A5_XIPMA
METLNRTGAVDYLHPCNEVGRFSSSLQNVSSKLCVLLYIFLAVAAVVTVCGNLLIIVSVGYFTQLHTPTNSLIVSLAATDLLVGVLVFPFSMAFSLSSCLLHEGLICQVRDTFDISLSTCSILNLCCIALSQDFILIFNNVQ